MPRTRSLAWSELKIGLLTIAAIGLAGILIFALSGSGGFSWQRYPLKTKFKNVAGLNEGAQVRIAGVPVGAVTGVAFVGNEVEVLFEVSKKVQPLITDRSTAVLGSVSLLGESAVDLTAGQGGTPVPEDGYVAPGPVAGSIADVTAQATTGIEELTALLQDIRSGKGTIGQLMTNDSLHRELNALLVSVNQVTQGINQGRGTLGRLMNDPTAAKSLEASMATLEAILSKIRAGDGSLGKFLNDDAFHTALTSTTANVNELTGRINRGEGTMGQLLNNREMFDRFNSTADRMDKLMAGLNAGEGTAGQVLRDKRLYENMNDTIAEMRKLVSDIRADPKKYLNVRVSLF
jgi:phospholipid/cholesterol/gamma-HCH transport system substrate-binding protein